LGIALEGEVSEMPRYFFHVKRGQVRVLDQEGVELADIAEETAEALERGRQIAASKTLRAVPASGGAIVIDEELHTVREVPFEDITEHNPNKASLECRPNRHGAAASLPSDAGVWAVG
jgi:Domain of unknown function (DUF6894)